MSLEFEMFFTRNVYRRVRDCYNRPVCSVPGSQIELVDRESNDFNWTFRYRLFLLIIHVFIYQRDDFLYVAFRCLICSRLLELPNL